MVREWSESIQATRRRRVVQLLSIRQLNAVVAKHRMADR